MKKKKFWSISFVILFFILLILFSDRIYPEKNTKEEMIKSIAYINSLRKDGECLNPNSLTAQRYDIALLYSSYPLISYLKLTEKEKKEISNYLNSFQDPITGLYHTKIYSSDKKSFSEYKEVNNNLFFTFLSINALKNLGYKPKYPLRFLRLFDTYSKMMPLLKDVFSKWNLKESINLFVISSLLLNENHQLKEFNKKEWSHKVLSYIESKRNNQTSLWHNPNKSLDFSDIIFAVHIWPIYAQAKREPIMKNPEKLIDYTLTFQKKNGHFFKGSPHHDLDGAWVLSNAMLLTNYKEHEVKDALKALIESNLQLQNKDGGFKFNFSSEESTPSNTIIRVLTLSLAEQAINQETQKNFHYKINSRIYPYNS